MNQVLYGIKYNHRNREVDYLWDSLGKDTNGNVIVLSFDDLNKVFGYRARYLDNWNWGYNAFEGYVEVIPPNTIHQPNI